MRNYDTWLADEPVDLIGERDEALYELDRELSEIEDRLDASCSDSERDAAMVRRDQILDEIERIE